MLDPNHDETSYVLSKIKDREVTTKFLEPNIFINDNLHGLAVATRYYIDGVQVAKIYDKGSALITVPVGKHDLLIQRKMYGEYRQQFEIKNVNSRVQNRTYYIKMGFRFSADVSVTE